MHDVELPMSAVQQTQGVSGSRRRVFKNLTNNPEEAREYLEQEGYETRRLPEEAGAWNFAVRKKGRSDQPWQVVDPDGMDAGDFFDLLGDIGLGVVSTAGAAVGSLLGPVGTALGAGAGGAGGEYVRQALGQAAGVPQDINLGKVALEGGLSAASVPAAALAGMGIRGAGRAAGKLVRVGDKLTNAITARMANVRNSARRSAEEINTDRALMAGYGQVAGAGENAPKLIDTLDELLEAQQGTGIGRLTFPARQKEQAMLIGAQMAGTKINLRSSVEAITDTTRMKPTGQTAQITTILKKVKPKGGGRSRMQPIQEDVALKEGGADLQREGITRFQLGKKGRMFRRLEKRRTTVRTLPMSVEGKRFMDDLQRMLGNRPSSSVDPMIADDILNHAAKRLMNPETSVSFAATLEEFIKRTEASIVRDMSGAVPDFAMNHGQLHGLVRKLNSLRKYTRPGADRAVRHDGAVKFLEDLGTDRKMEYLSYMHDLEQEFGFEPGLLTDLVHKTTVSRSFGHRGAAQTLGPMTTTGQFRGAALLGGGGALGGFAAGGPMGALVGGAAGTLLGVTAGTPSVMLATRRASLKVGSILHPAMQKLTTIGGAHRLALPSGALRVAARPVVQSAIVEQKPHRKQVQIGQF
jgi:hypothetical protein